MDKLINVSLPSTSKKRYTSPEVLELGGLESQVLNTGSAWSRDEPQNRRKPVT